MTCIIAYKDSNNNTIYMCGDKCGSNGINPVKVDSVWSLVYMN